VSWLVTKAMPSSTRIEMTFSGLLIVSVPVGGRKKKLYAIDEAIPANSPVRRPNRLAAAITGSRYSSATLPRLRMWNSALAMPVTLATIIVVQAYPALLPQPPLCARLLRVAEPASIGRT
jgi:hypothetical protein